MTKVYSKCFNEIGAFNDTRYIVGMLEKVMRHSITSFNFNCFGSLLSGFLHLCLSFFLEIDRVHIIIRALCFEQRSKLIFNGSNVIFQTSFSPSLCLFDTSYEIHCTSMKNGKS